MALLLKIESNKGVEASYHRIISITQVYEGQVGIHINLAGYKSADYRTIEQDTGEEMIIANTPVFLPFKKTGGFERDIIYGRIKAEVVELKNSEDV